MKRGITYIGLAFLILLSFNNYAIEKAVTYWVSAQIIEALKPDNLK